VTALDALALVLLVGLVARYALGRSWDRPARRHRDEPVTPLHWRRR